MFKDFDSQKTTKTITDFISHETTKAGFSKVVIALSGGIDSTVSTYLAVKALGSSNVLVVMLPYKNLSPESLRDALVVTKELSIPEDNVFKVDIAQMVDAFIKLDPDMDEIRRGNVMARCRMVVLFDLAKKHHALVCGTENKSEHLLAYYTRFGDEASDLEPIRNLYKTEVRQLARYLHIPPAIIEKAPTAGLWEGQTDEKQFGFSYENADEILKLIFDKRETLPQIVNMGYKKEVVEKVYSWVKKNEFKHNLPKVASL